jgi:Fe2+ transport system protein FeoA
MSLFNTSFPWRSRSLEPKNAVSAPSKGQPQSPQPQAEHRFAPTLADAPLGRSVRVAGFDQRISSQRWSQLQSYGLIPGSWVAVLQHAPVTIVRIEHLELALERDVALLVLVGSGDSSLLPR